MTYFTEEISITNDGSVACAITPRESYNQAISAYHQILASATINTNVKKCYCEVKDDSGLVYKSEVYEA